ncbi:hypothetical protein R7D97_21575 [Vibrio sp. Vb5031]|uniref:hypothetical protein n=2 Tax=Vibrionaceae TaxID=641 RepID=UPI001BD3B197|nr:MULTISPECIES: hypothetical protein [Vibrio]MBT0091777.1 hypothetical protein [Vibrio alginolyticus]MCR9559143.1 hypothetical protein [Vibrio alginolyticus]MDW1506785.1 hypothetical protein [Vibrio sp. Vb5031]
MHRGAMIMQYINAAVVALAERVNFGISGVQRACKVGYDHANRIADEALKKGYFCHNYDYPEYQNLRVSDRGLELAAELRQKATATSEG